jgi:DNA polymerase III subunit alpha
MSKFIHLRTHTNYSVASGMLFIEDIAKTAKEYSLPAIAITDTNNMFGVREFSLKLSSYGIQPIIGMEINLVYIVNRQNFCGKVVLLAKNLQGYQSLLKLHYLAYLTNLNKHLPIHINQQDLLNNNEGLIVLTGGLDGILTDIIEKNPKELNSFLDSTKSTFKDNIFLEINRFFTQKDKDLEMIFLQKALDFNLPIIATNNIFFKNPSDKFAADVLQKIRIGETINEEGTNILNPHQYFKNQDEMCKIFSDLPEATSNTIYVAKQCLYQVNKNPPALPKFSDNENQLIKELSFKGLQSRMESQVYNIIKKPKEELDNIYYQRLNYELSVIEKMGFDGYFLIVSDFIKYAKNNNIPVGPGRGSGAGSIVAWALEITDVNPIRFSLLFERFLNPERVSMPDFDIDFCQERRDEVIEYVKNKYGSEKVAHIITFGTLQTRAAIRDVGRVLAIPYIDVDTLCKKIPQSLPSNPITLKNVLDENEELKQEVISNAIYQDLFDIALKVEGLYRNISTHAAGIVIGAKNLNEIIPLFYEEGSKLPSAGFSMKYVEDTGLIKFDFLGLKTLTVIKHTLNNLQKIGINIDILNIPLEEEEISKLLSSGKTLGVFQLESKGMTDILEQMKPNKIEDIIAVISLYRPGPMENIPSYIDRKQGKEKIEYLHPEMEQILSETYGIMIYQEQVMEVAQKLAGYSLGEADLLRRAMGKKDPKEMKKQEEIFVKGATANNIDKETALAIFYQMEKFAGYGFNKSHATAYALISWQTAYLKSYHKEQFLASSMTYEIQSTDKLLEFIEEAKKENITILPPKINKPSTSFMIEEHNSKKCIRYCLKALKGLSDNFLLFTLEDIAKSGEYSSFQNFLERTKKEYINKKNLEALIKAGAFDDLDENRNKLLKNIESILNYIAKLDEAKNSNQIDFFSLTSNTNNKEQDSLILQNTEFFTHQEKMIAEADIIGFFLSSHPLQVYQEKIEATSIKYYQQVLTNKEKSATIIGCLLKLKISKTKSGAKISNLTFSDTKGVYELALFGSNYNKFSHILKEGEIYLLKLNIKYEDSNSTNNEKSQERVYIENIILFTESLLKDYSNKDIEITLTNKQGLIYIRDRINTLKEGNTKIIIKVILEDKSQAIFITNKTYHTPEIIIESIKKSPYIESITV